MITGHQLVHGAEEFSWWAAVVMLVIGWSIMGAIGGLCLVILVEMYEVTKRFFGK